MHTEKACWIIILTIFLINIFLIDILCVNAQFYFPVTSGLSSFYHYGTLRYGTLFGLSGVNPYAIGCGIWGFPYGWHIPGAMGFWGDFMRVQALWDHICGLIEWYESRLQ